MCFTKGESAEAGQLTPEGFNFIHVAQFLKRGTTEFCFEAFDNCGTGAFALI